jgi:DNA-binding NtrC family response regulator
MTADPAKRRILVVDDEITVGKSISQALACDDYVIDTALSGAEALQKEGLNKYEVIIADLMMPGLSGLDLLASLRRLGSAARVIVVTGYPTMKTTVQSMQSGAFEYLPKPFLPAELRSAVARALASIEDDTR